MQYQKYGKPLFKITSIILTASQLATITSYEKTIIAMKKLSAKELCSTLISNVESKHNPQLYFGKSFQLNLLNGTKYIYHQRK